jgi:N6-adenosine-specific RNA methylase IME4
MGKSEVKLPAKKYQIIYADPPWSYNDKLDKRRRLKYGTEDIEWIADLPVGDIADKDCTLFLWVTMPKLSEVWPVIERWGFTYKTVAFTWVKTIKLGRSLAWGMGRWTRSNAELCLIATKGKPKRAHKGIHSVVISPIREHSRKPDEIRNLIVKLCGDLPRIELFSRESIPGWDSWGNQAQNKPRRTLLD